MLIPIGQFSKLARISIKALRLYAERGLLLPAHTDADTGYRYYRPSQAKRAEIIRILRSVEMPLDEIREVLDASGSVAAHERLLVHRQHMAERLQVQQRMLIYLESLIENKERIMAYEITVQEAKPLLVAGIRMLTNLRTIKTDVPQAFGKIMQGINSKRFVPVGPPMIVYNDVIDEENDAEVEVCIPITHAIDTGNDFHCHELTDKHVAVTVHHGPYEELSSAYHSMLGWISENGYELSGSPREIYLNDPGNTSPEQLQTQLEFPVSQCTAKRTDQ